MKANYSKFYLDYFNLEDEYDNSDRRSNGKNLFMLIILF